jgi:hypothetical protein
MKKTVLILSILAATYGVSATPDANFQPGGLVVGGSGYLEYYTPDGQATETEIYIAPNIQVFVMPYLSVGVGGSFGTYTQAQQTTADYPKWLKDTYSAWVSLDYYIPVAPKFYVAPGVSVGYNNDSGWITYATSGSTPTWNWAPNYAIVGNLRGLYFITDNLAPYIGVMGRMWFYPSNSKTDKDVKLNFGIDWFIPDSALSFI